MGESLQTNIVAVLSKAINALPVAVKHAELTVFNWALSHFDLSTMLRCPTWKRTVSTWNVINFCAIQRNLDRQYLPASYSRDVSTITLHILWRWLNDAVEGYPLLGRLPRHCVTDRRRWFDCCNWKRTYTATVGSDSWQPKWRRANESFVQLLTAPNTAEFHH